MIDRHELIPAILIIPLKGDNLFVGVSTREITGDFAGLSARQPLSSSNFFKFGFWIIGGRMTTATASSNRF